MMLFVNAALKSTMSAQNIVRQSAKTENWHY